METREAERDQRGADLARPPEEAGQRLRPQPEDEQEQEEEREAVGDPAAAGRGVGRDQVEQEAAAGRR